MEKVIVCSDGKIKLEELDRAFIHAWLHRVELDTLFFKIMWLVWQISACVWIIWDKWPFLLMTARI